MDISSSKMQINHNIEEFNEEQNIKNNKKIIIPIFSIFLALSTCFITATLMFPIFHILSFTIAVMTISSASLVSATLSALVGYQIDQYIYYKITA